MQHCVDEGGAGVHQLRLCEKQYAHLPTASTRFQEAETEGRQSIVVLEEHLEWAQAHFVCGDCSEAKSGSEGYYQPRSITVSGPSFCARLVQQSCLWPSMLVEQWCHKRAWTCKFGLKTSNTKNTVCTEQTSLVACWLNCLEQKDYEHTRIMERSINQWAKE